MAVSALFASSRAAADFPDALQVTGSNVTLALTTCVECLVRDLGVASPRLAPPCSARPFRFIQ